MINFDIMDNIDFSSELKLSPKTLIHKYDENYFLIALVDQPEANFFLKHLLTVIYSFTDWKTPEELFVIWPEDTLNDFIETIKTLIIRKILVNKDEYQKDIQLIASNCTYDKATSDFYLSQSYFSWIKNFKPSDNSLWLNFNISEDTLNNLNNSIPGNFIITNPDICKVSQARNNLSMDKFTFICTNSHIFSPVCFANKFDNLLFQANNVDILIKNILKSVIYNKKNLLKNEGKVFPHKINLKAFLFEGLGYQTLFYEAKEFDYLYGFDFSTYRNSIQNHTMRFNQKINLNSIKKLSQDKLIYSFDLNSIIKSDFNLETTIETTESGTLCGLCVYIEILLDEQNSVSLSPFNKLIETEQVIFKLVCPTHKQKGELINLKLIMDNDLSLSIQN